MYWQPSTVNINFSIRIIRFIFIYGIVFILVCEHLAIRIFVIKTRKPHYHHTIHPSKIISNFILQSSSLHGTISTAFLHLSYRSMLFCCCRSLYHWFCSSILKSSIHFSKFFCSSGLEWNLSFSRNNQKTNNNNFRMIFHYVRIYWMGLKAMNWISEKASSLPYKDRK